MCKNSDFFITSNRFRFSYKCIRDHSNEYLRENNADGCKLFQHLLNFAHNRILLFLYVKKKNSKNLNINNLNCHGLFLLFIFKDEAANKIILSQGHTHDWCISCNHSGLCNSLLQGLSLFSSLQETALGPLLLTGTCHHTVWWHHFPNLSCLPQLFFNHHMNTHTHTIVYLLTQP